MYKPGPNLPAFRKSKLSAWSVDPIYSYILDFFNEARSSISDDEITKQISSAYIG